MARVAGVVFVLLALAWTLVLAAGRDERRTVRRVNAHRVTAVG